MTFDENKMVQFRKVFITIKILAILFCMSPTFQYFFRENTATTFEHISIPAILVSLALISIITFMWLIVDYSGRGRIMVNIIEIAIFFAVCVVSIMLSGMYESYYKFTFIFLVVSYTIEFGMNVGFGISGAATVFLFTLDIIKYTANGVNVYFQSDIALVAMFFVVAWTLGVYVKLEKQHIDDLKNFANIDGLTQIYNHRYFHEDFKRKCEFAAKSGAPISLLLMDIDYFKTYNDLFGHLKGDDILREISKLLRENLPVGGEIYRYGGEEFSVILEAEDQTAALGIAERMRTLVSNYEFDGEELLPNGRLTVSIGVANLLGADDSFTAVISRADSALFKAKYFRKNRVEVFTSLFEGLNDLSIGTESEMQPVKSFFTIINSRDRYTYNHTERVVRYCDIFADYLKLEPQSKKRLIFAAYLHDLGKINVSKATLISEKKLTDEEWEEMKRHPQDGADIIRQMKDMDDVADIVSQHHEKYNGRGYPRGLAGEDILFAARMLTLADSFDAMTAKRPYQDQRSYDDAFAEIRRCSGTQFDPNLTEKFIASINEATE
ncbi:MAG: diguanylate cyclase [Eubacteriales bacterium]